MSAARILIAGIGNIFLGDDAFGVEAAQALAAQPWPRGVAVRDFGIRCLDLAYTLLDDWDAAILVDAAARGDAPGTVYRIDLDTEAEPTDNAEPNLDAHGITVNQVRRMAHRLSRQAPGRLPRMLLVGCEPASFDPELLESGGGLTAPVAAALPAALAMVRELVHELTTVPSLEVTAT